MLHNLNRRTVIAGIAGAVPAAAAVGAVPALVSPDAELVELGKRLRASWNTLRAALARDCATEEFDALYDDGFEIVLEIEAIPATTIAGLKVKALAVAWCAGSETFADDENTEQENPCIYDRMNASLFRDLRTIGAAS